jgi:DeoR/GlpR family transcriptional regulator of sugar metabolism
MVEGFHVDIAICSCKGIDAENGVTDSNERDSEIKKAFFKSATRKVLAVDSSKFNKVSFVKVCGLADVDTVVTDAEPGELWKENLLKLNTSLVFEKQDFED